MASPLVAGAVAAYIGTQAAAPTPAQVREWLLNSALRGRVTDEGTSSPNKLLHVPCEGADNPQPAGYTAVDENCYETYMDLENTTEGTIAFPADPVRSYPTRFAACWHIQCDEVVELVWAELDLVYRSYVHVYNASNPSYPTLQELVRDQQRPDVIPCRPCRGALHKLGQPGWDGHHPAVLVCLRTSADRTRAVPLPVH